MLFNEGGVTTTLEKGKEKSPTFKKKKCSGYMAIYSVKATKRKRVCHLRSTVTMRPSAVPQEGNWLKCVRFRLVQGSMLVGDDGGEICWSGF